MAFSQIPSFAARVAATYSASVEDSETVACFFDLHAIAPPAKV